MLVESTCMKPIPDQDFKKEEVTEVLIQGCRRIVVTGLTTIIIDCLLSIIVRRQLVVVRVRHDRL